MSDGTQELFDLDSLNHMESEYGVFVSDSGQDQDKLDILKQLAQSMVQNGVPASTIAEMVDADNFSQIKEKIKSAENAQQKLQEAQQEAEAKQAEAQRNLEREKLENENYNQEKDRETKIRVALIQAESKMLDNQYNANKASQDMMLKQRQNELKSEEVAEKNRSNLAKESLIKEDQQLKSAQSVSTNAQKEQDRLQNQEEKAKDRAIKMGDQKIKLRDQNIKKQIADKKPKSE